MSSTNNESSIENSQKSSIEDVIIEKLKNQNEKFLYNLVALEKSQDERNKSFEKFLHVYKSKKEANLRSIEMLQQRQSLGEQKIQEMVYLLQLLKIRARQMGIDDESESGSDDVFDDDESDESGNEE